jgi:hypothetical protein
MSAVIFITYGYYGYTIGRPTFVELNIATYASESAQYLLRFRFSTCLKTLMRSIKIYI